MNIDKTSIQRIAHATSERDGGARWAELSIFYNARQRRFVARSVGKSNVPGEVDRVRELYGNTLDQVLALFDNGSALGRMVISQAEQWDESFIASAEQAVAEGEATLSAGLARLFGDATQGQIADTLGINRSSLTRGLQAEREGREVSLTVPLMKVMPFIDPGRIPHG